MGLLLSLPLLSHPALPHHPPGVHRPSLERSRESAHPALTAQSPSIKQKLLAQASLHPKQPQGGGYCLREVVSSLSQGWMSNLSHFSAAARRGCTE